MTSTSTRRSSNTKAHSRSSSSTTTTSASLQIATPTDSSPAPSPTFDKPARVNMAPVNGNNENAKVNGTKSRLPLNRKQSSPMMPPFMVSAPGKVIVFGEHAVVH